MTHDELTHTDPRTSTTVQANRTCSAKALAERQDQEIRRSIEALFTSDADQQTTSGEWRRGRAQIVPGTLESSRRNVGTRAITVESVRFLTRDVALVDGPYEIGGSEGAAVRRMRTTIVLTRESDGWRIAAIRNMVPTQVR